MDEGRSKEVVAALQKVSKNLPKKLEFGEVVAMLTWVSELYSEDMDEAAGFLCFAGSQMQKLSDLFRESENETKH